MKKDVEKNFLMRSPAPIRWRRIVLFGILSLLGCIAIFSILQYKKNLSETSTNAVYFSRIKAWVTERKNRFHRDITKAKRFLANKDQEESNIHFEFYTALPNIQVVAAPTASAKEALPQKKEGPRPKLVDAKALEKDFAKQLKQVSDRGT